jgi:2-iminobutanoate/2-iminopropanoate deaminase
MLPQKKNNIPIYTLLLHLCCTYCFAQHDVTQPIGPYSRYTYDANYIFISGQIALNAEQKIDTTSFETECRMVLNQIKLILLEAGSDWNQVIKTTIYTTRMEKFSQINAVYESYVSKPYPARETVGVCSLPKHARIEISVIAKKRH